MLIFFQSPHSGTAGVNSAHCLGTHFSLEDGGGGGGLLGVARILG